MVISSRKPQILIPARNSTPELILPIQHASFPAKGPSVTVKKKKIAQNKKFTAEEELVIAKKSILALNLDSEQTLVSDLFKENKKDDQVEDVTDRLMFKLCIDSLTA
ncbi:hypothetical protein RclHR1_00080028 [Rhizophagus clarus]|uniref:Uncharacterized protein n=1 Tax=Rhizophagus clarus TaxID=94130 RepID=A0A2Z6S196_9GLOM|nr:hypothetical protein RclHR1_00080028 [Rhizophagus clarus]GES89929.1 hypothetical protein RCL_jg23717.t1 [Rhizophagus clarus]